MAEIIQTIEPITIGDKYSTESGFAVTTDKQIIKLLIDDEASCCESWGYFMSEDDTSAYIGAELLSVDVVDEALNVHAIEELGDLDAGGIMFVNLKTSRGVLQFVAYNAHNGYYSHTASVTSEQVTYMVGL